MLNVNDVGTTPSVGVGDGVGVGVGLTVGDDVGVDEGVGVALETPEGEADGDVVGKTRGVLCVTLQAAIKAANAKSVHPRRETRPPGPIARFLTSLPHQS